MSNLCAKCLTRIDEGRMYCKDCDDSAKGMFEKLGYKQIKNNDEFIEYEKNGRNISFELETHTFSGVHVWLDCQAILIDMQELQAINKQVSELGWNDE